MIVLTLDHDGSILNVTGLQVGQLLEVRAYLDANEDAIYPVRHDEDGNPYEWVRFSRHGEQAA